MSLSIEVLSQPVSEEAPSGENLEYDSRYMEMENLFRSKPESSLRGFENENTGPDWKGVGKLAADLSQQTRDLRVQVYATIAAIHTSGLTELRDHLELLNIYLQSFWDSLHPQLDPDDGNDPTQRSNILQVLGKPDLVAAALDKIQLVEMKGIGRIGMHEVALAQGTVSPDEGEEILNIKLIRQAFQETEPDFLENLQASVVRCGELFSEINSTWKEKSGDPANMDFEAPVKALGRIGSVLAEYSPQLVDEAAVATADSDVSAPPPPGVVNSRADVIRTLDRICDYYEANEPSSPVPLLLRRAQRLVEKSFMEILEDMVPDGVQQAKLVSGTKDDD